LRVPGCSKEGVCAARQLVPGSWLIG